MKPPQGTLAHLTDDALRAMILAMQFNTGFCERPTCRRFRRHQAHKHGQRFLDAKLELAAEIHRRKVQAVRKTSSETR